ncbi:MAG: hypothetical protein ACI89E_001303 [Planctomycetota bacterium]|jgi:hypothetical protein
MSKTKVLALLFALLVCFVGLKYLSPANRYQAPLEGSDDTSKVNDIDQPSLQVIRQEPTQTSRKALKSPLNEEDEKEAESEVLPTRVESWLNDQVTAGLDNLSLTGLVWTPDWLNKLPEKEYFAYQAMVVEYRALEPEFFREKFRQEGLEHCLELLLQHTPESSVEEKARLGFAIHFSIDSALYLTLLNAGGRVHEISEDSSEFDDYYDKGTYKRKTRMIFEMQHVVMFYNDEEVPFLLLANEYLKSVRPLPLAEKPTMPNRFAMFIGLPPLLGQIQADLIAAYTHATAIQARRVPSINPFRENNPK